MKSKMLGLMLVAVVLAGCNTQQYKMVKAGITDEQAAMDDAKCQNQSAMIQVADWEYRGTFAEGANIQIKQQKAYNNCMFGKGYHTVPM